MWGLDRRGRLFALQIAAVLVVLAVTNPGVPERVSFLLGDHLWAGFAAFVLLWSLAIAAMLIVVLLPNIWLRGFWAVVIAASGAAGFCFHLASRTELSIFDAV